VLKDNNGHILESREDMEESLIDYYSELMEELAPDQGEYIAKILSAIPQIVSNFQNYLLMQPITMSELDESLCQMKEGTTSGPDGFTINFFHSFWDMINLVSSTLFSIMINGSPTCIFSPSWGIR